MDSWFESEFNPIDVILKPPMSPLSADTLPLMSADVNLAAEAVNCPVEPVIES